MEHTKKALDLYNAFERRQLMRLKNYCATDKAKLASVQYKDGNFYASDGWQAIKSEPVDCIVESLGLADGDYFFIEYVTLGKALVVITHFPSPPTDTFADIQAIFNRITDNNTYNEDPIVAVNPDLFKKIIAYRYDEPIELHPEAGSPLRPVKLHFTHSGDTVYLMPMSPKDRQRT